ncbi:MAG: helix-turn-helix transcriptional regulator [Candidatus Sumerlaeota bacterium]|nr:helix-turn-helix transcriptional regulator [Candidatus Sumerlaeota bacterium]
MIDATKTAADSLPSYISERLAKIRPADEILAKWEQEEKINWDLDPEFAADFPKSLFVEYIYEAMEDTGITKSELARRLGKSRQYVNKILREDKTVNFTVETMAAICCALGRKLDVQMMRLDERIMIMPLNRAPARTKHSPAIRQPKIFTQERKMILAAKKISSALKAMKFDNRNSQEKKQKPAIV